MSEAGPHLLFCGDPHGDFTALRRAVARARPAAVVLLGDLDLERPAAEEFADVIAAGIAVLWVPGNHDAQATRWHHHLIAGGLGAGALHGRVLSVGGARLAGLGGIFMEAVWRPGAAPGRPPWRTAAEWLAAHPEHDTLPGLLRGAIWPADYDRVAALAADILVCHDAPASHRKEYGALDALAAAVGARLIVHGHHHESYAATLGNGVRAVGVANRATWRLPLADAVTPAPDTPPDRPPVPASG